MIRFTMMPGEDGDCLLLEYGDDGSYAGSSSTAVAPARIR